MSKNSYSEEENWTINNYDVNYDSPTSENQKEKIPINDSCEKNPFENPDDDATNSKEDKIIVEEMSPKLMVKTQVEISVNGNTYNVKWLKITKPSKAITLNDIKPLLLKQPKMYGMTNELTYTYWAKTSKGGKVGFEHIDEDDLILPMFGDKIELQCWSE